MRRMSVVLATVALVVGLAGPAVAADPVPAPSSMSALGDSITAGFHTGCGLLNDCPENSWSTGSAIDSHATRIGALRGAPVATANVSVSGAVAADLVSQASAVPADAGYATVLIGANDACTSTVAAMTPVEEFRSQVRAGLGELYARAPDAAVFVASVPDLQRLLDVGKGSFSARFTWSLYGICQSMLAAPLSTAQADVDRRATVRQRVVDFNTVLAEECAAYAGTCLDDAGTVFSYPFELSHLSTIDYFHPNVTGQQLLAGATWDVTYTFTTGEPAPNAPPTADAGPDQTVTADESGSASVTLDGSGSSDPDGTVVSWDWSTGDSGEVVTTPLAVGTTAVTLTVTDDDGATATDTVTITVEPAPVSPSTVHVGDLEGRLESSRKKTVAVVTVTVVDAGGAVVEGASVTGEWSGGAKGGGTCVTGAEGTCDVEKNLRRGSVTFTVTGIDAPGATYDAALNVDADGDTDGTRITIG